MDRCKMAAGLLLRGLQGVMVCTPAFMRTEMDAYDLLVYAGMLTVRVTFATSLSSTGTLWLQRWVCMLGSSCCSFTMLQLKLAREGMQWPKTCRLFPHQKHAMQEAEPSTIA